VPLIWGAPLKNKNSVWKDETHNPISIQGEMPEFRSEASWSLTLAELRRDLSEPGCPICRAEKKALQVYYGWLSREIKSTPSYRGSDTIWLCREHVLDFLRVGEEGAVSRLGEAAREYWLIELEKLRVGLEDKPKDFLMRRAVEAARRLRKQVASGKGQGLWRSFQRHFTESVKYLCQSPKSVFVELRKRWL
jgi:hypothetical protein